MDVKKGQQEAERYPNILLFILGTTGAPLTSYVLRLTPPFIVLPVLVTGVTCGFVLSLVEVHCPAALPPVAVRTAQGFQECQDLLWLRRSGFVVVVSYVAVGRLPP